VAADIDVARNFYDVLNRWLQEYRAHPAPLEEMESLEQVFECLTDDAVWSWPLTPESFQGRDELVRALTDYLETAGNWEVELEELRDGPKDLFAVTRIHAEGKGSGAPVDQRVFSAVTVRDGKVARIEDHLDRDEAMRAAGLET
jgi:ketosteroid isomerase-like protein